MKKKALKSAVSLILRLSAILTIFLTLSNLDFALAESATLTVSCSIPSIPGVNAPLIEDRSTRASESQPAIQQQANALQIPSPSMLQTDKETTLKTPQSVTPMLIKTFYCR